VGNLFLRMRVPKRDARVAWVLKMDFWRLLQRRVDGYQGGD